MKRMGKLSGALAALALAGGLTVGMTGTAHAEVTPPAGTWAEIFNPYTNSAPVCLDDPSGSTAVGTLLQVWHCHGYASNGTPERWLFGDWGSEGPGVHDWVVETANGPLCLGPSGTGAAGSRVALNKCFIGPVWNLHSLGADTAAYPDFELELYHTGLCMTLPDWSGGNGEPVILEPCRAGNTLQHWVLG